LEKFDRDSAAAIPTVGFLSSVSSGGVGSVVGVSADVGSEAADATAGALTSGTVDFTEVTDSAIFVFILHNKW